MLDNGSISCEQVQWENPEGRHIFHIILSRDKTAVHVTNLGCAVTAIYTPDRSGISKNIAAGYDCLSHYAQNPHYFGCLLGRYANRIGNARFLLEGRAVQLSRNEGDNHLHGGFQGFNKKIWEVASFVQSESQVGVIFKYTSRDGEEGYPGNLEVEVKYLLESGGKLGMYYSAVTDQTTPVNLSNHSYFNLSGFDNPVVNDHVLRIHAARYTEKNGRNLPTGRILPVSGTALDYLTPKRIGECIEELTADLGYDHNYVLDQEALRPDASHSPASYPPASGPAGPLVPAAELWDPASGRSLKVSTTQPGMQLYTANWWDGTITGAQGVPYVRHGAVALETQAFPDSPNQPAFPSTLLHPGNVYRAVTEFTFGIIPGPFS